MYYMAEILLLQHKTPNNHNIINSKQHPNLYNHIPNVSFRLEI